MRLLLRLAAGLAFGTLASAQTTQFEDNPIPDLFAALMALTLADEVSTASFRVDTSSPQSEDTRFTNLKLPWSRTLPLRGADALRLTAALGGLLAEDHIFVDTASGLATVDEQWLMLGGELGLAWVHALGHGWNVQPGIALGLAHLSNDADYNEAGRIELAPLIEGTLVNWDAWAANTSAHLTLARPRASERLAAGWTARYALARSHVFGATEESQEGSDSSRFAAVRAELGGPTGWSRHGAPLQWDVFGGAARLGGVDRDSLGFDELYELGAGLTLRLSERFPPLRLGAAWLTGPDVRGVSFGLSLP